MRDSISLTWLKYIIRKIWKFTINSGTTKRKAIFLQQKNIKDLKRFAKLWLQASLKKNWKKKNEMLHDSCKKKLWEKKTKTPGQEQNLQLFIVSFSSNILVVLLLYIVVAWWRLFVRLCCSKSTNIIIIRIHVFEFSTN